MPFLPALWFCHRGTIKFDLPAFPETMKETAPGNHNRRWPEFDLKN